MEKQKPKKKKLNARESDDDGQTSNVHNENAQPIIFFLHYNHHLELWKIWFLIAFIQTVML